MKIRKHLTQVINSLDGNMIDFDTRLSADSTDPCSMNSPHGTGLDLTGITYVSKLLIVAAYICSRNKQDTDRLMFDPTHRARKKRKMTIKKVNAPRMVLTASNIEHDNDMHCSG